MSKLKGLKLKINIILTLGVVLIPLLLIILTLFSPLFLIINKLSRLFQNYQDNRYYKHLIKQLANANKNKQKRK